MTKALQYDFITIPNNIKILPSDFKSIHEYSKNYRIGARK